MNAENVRQIIVIKPTSTCEILMNLLFQVEVNNIARMIHKL